MADVRRKEELFRRYDDESSYRTSGRFLAGLWCAAFFWKKTRDFDFPITERIFRRVWKNPHDVQPWMYEEVRRLAEEHQFFHWHLAYPDVFRVPIKDGAPENEQTGWSGGFDTVVGNPPWVRQELLKPIKPLLCVYETFKSTADSSVYFLERGVQIVRTGRRVGLLTPNKWFRTDYAEPLRCLLRHQTETQLLVDFGHARTLFIGADVFPAAVVLLVTRHRADDPTLARYVRAYDADRAQNDLGYLIANCSIAIPHAQLQPSRWELEHPQVCSLFHRLLRCGQRLAARLSKSIVRGVLTGLNEAFVINEVERKALIKADPASSGVIKPWLPGAEVERWSPCWSGDYLIFSRRGINIDEYPAVRDHLLKWKSPLTPKRRTADPGEGRKPGSYQ